MLKLVVIVVIAFAHGEQREEPRIARRTFRRVRLGPDHVTGAVDQEGAVLEKDDPGHAREQEPAERTRPAIPEEA